MASNHVPHMLKALDQMNLQLHHVISDFIDMTGVAILEAILAGERDPQTLATLSLGRDRSVLLALCPWAGIHILARVMSRQPGQRWESAAGQNTYENLQWLLGI